MQRFFVSYHFNLVSVRVGLVTVGVRQKKLTLIKDQGGLQPQSQHQHKQHLNQLSVNISISIKIDILDMEVVNKDSKNFQFYRDKSEIENVRISNLEVW